MSSLESEFKLLDRGFKNTIVLVPGWATDYRIFSVLNIDYNYIIPVRFNPFRFNSALDDFLENGHFEKVSFFGWSLGGFVASHFAAGFPQKVEELVLLSVKASFNPDALETIRQKIIKNKKAYLYRFYLDCFPHNEQSGFSWFKDNLLKIYLENTKTGDLIEGLRYFSQYPLQPESLSGIKKGRLFRGLEDKIIPFQESEELKSALINFQFVDLKNTGHAPFLTQDFPLEFAHG